MGITLNAQTPISYFPEDPESQNTVNAQFAQSFEWFTEPIFGSGDYSQNTKVLIGNVTRINPDTYLPVFTPEEIENNKGTSDFFGLNLYNGNLIPASDNINQGKFEAVETTPLYDELEGERALPNFVVCPSWWNGGSEWIYNTPFVLS
jgi:hypothetical protein